MSVKGRWSAALALGFSVVFAGGGAAAQSGPAPVMTVKILNNAGAFNLYPVLSVGYGGPSAPDEWMQAYFQVPANKLGTDLYPRTSAYRIYIAPSGDGIPAKHSITLTLPLFTKLVGTIDPTKGEQFIDWWQGGGIRMFQNTKAAGAPPAALVSNLKNRPDQMPVTFPSGAMKPVCRTDTGGSCRMEIFSDKTELPLGDPYQLLEYTLGAVNRAEKPFTLDTENVDIDVSYVDSAFSPALMEPYPNKNKIWGWVGVNRSIADFNAIVAKFLNDYPGWPQFVDNRGQSELKIPSPLNIFVVDEINDSLNSPHARTDLTPLPWPPIQKLVDGYEGCTLGCARQMEIKKLLETNYKHYVGNYGTESKWGCDPKQMPVKNTRNQIIGHVYGWSPWNTYCTADANQLYHTPGYYIPGNPPDSRVYEAVKRKFDELQLITGFNPYVDFIHGADYLDAPNVYAYSVDDAVGNLQVDDETGFYVAVASPNGLPNRKPAGPIVNANFGYSTTDKVRFVKYGVCTLVPDHKVKPIFTSFVLPGDGIGDCPVSFLDNRGQSYRYRVTASPPYVLFPKQDASVIDCAGNDANGMLWCKGAFAQSKIDDSNGRTVNYLIAPAPPQPAP